MDEGYGWVVMRMTTGHLHRANEMRIPGSRRGSGERRGGDFERHPGGGGGGNDCLSLKCRLCRHVTLKCIAQELPILPV